MGAYSRHACLAGYCIMVLTICNWPRNCKFTYGGSGTCTKPIFIGAYSYIRNYVGS